LESTQGFGNFPAVAGRAKQVSALGGGEDVTKIGQHAHIVHTRADPDWHPLDPDGLFSEYGYPLK
jgi:hypothetical protein